jgi:hypothetical protein
MRAEEMRTLADGMRHKNARGMLLRLEGDYDRIAAMVEKGGLEPST